MQCYEVSEWVNGWMDEWMNGWMDGWMNGWMDEWMNGWMDGWMNEWMNEWMNDNICITNIMVVSLLLWIVIELPIFTDVNSSFFLTFLLKDKEEKLPCQPSTSLQAVFFNAIFVLLNREATAKDVNGFRIREEQTERDLDVTKTVGENGLQRGSVVRRRSRAMNSNV